MTPLSQLARETAEPFIMRVWGNSRDLEGVDRERKKLVQAILSALEKATAEAAEEPIDGDTDASIGRSWRENSSLEKWFPFTAKEIKDLRTQADALAEYADHKRNCDVVIRQSEPSYSSKLPPCTCGLRAALAAYRKEKQP